MSNAVNAPAIGRGLLSLFFFEIIWKYLFLYREI